MFCEMMIKIWILFHSSFCTQQVKFYASEIPSEGPQEKILST